MQANIKELSKAWENELKEIQNHREYTRLKSYVALLHTCDVVIDEFQKKKRSINKQNNLYLVNHYFFSHTYHLSCSIYHLAKLGFGNACLVLSRSIIESTIDMAYLWLCKQIHGDDLEREAWGLYEFVNRDKMHRMWEDMQKRRLDKSLAMLEPIELFDQENADNFKLRKKEMVERFGRVEWARLANLQDRAMKVDETQRLFKEVGISLEELYCIGYRWTSEFAHGASSGSSGYFEAKANGGYIVDFGPNFRNTDIVIPFTARTMLGMLFMTNHINNLNLDLAVQLAGSGFDKHEIEIP